MDPHPKLHTKSQGHQPSGSVDDILKGYRQIAGIPMGTNCAPLVTDSFCYERDFMLSLSDNNQADVDEAFNSTSRYLHDLLNIDNPYLEQMVSQIYHTELQLNKSK